MKDAVTGDTPRTGGSNLRPGDFRMGQPVQSNVCTLCTEYIGAEELTRGTEISKYPEENRTTIPIYRDNIPPVATSEKGTA
jgi:hypothetical protein